MPYSLVPTPILEAILNDANNEQAAAELQRLHDVNCHLLTHYVATKQQSEATHAGLDLLLGEIEPEAPPQLPRCRLK